MKVNCVHINQFALVEYIFKVQDYKSKGKIANEFAFDIKVINAYHPLNSTAKYSNNDQFLRYSIFQQYVIVTLCNDFTVDRIIVMWTML